MMVAVAALRPSSGVAPSFPPQQSPMFGQRASSHTVCRPRPRKSFLILENDAPFGIDVFKCDGRRGLGGISHWKPIGHIKCRQDAPFSIA